MISSFSGEYRWLSNFWPVPGWSIAPTVEHRYQAAKTGISSEKEAIWLAPTPGKAKRLGSKVILSAGWESWKLSVMEQLLRAKFEEPGLRAKLLATGDEELVEGNNWGDTFWGVCNGEGENHLGKLLMKIRDELVATQTY